MDIFRTIDPISAGSTGTCSKYSYYLAQPVLMQFIIAINATEQPIYIILRDALIQLEYRHN